MQWPDYRLDRVDKTGQSIDGKTLVVDEEWCQFVQQLVESKDERVM